MEAIVEQKSIREYINTSKRSLNSSTRLSLSGIVDLLGFIASVVFLETRWGWDTFSSDPVRQKFYSLSSQIA